MAAPTIKFKRGSQANLPALAAGEPAFVNDEFNLYLGLDGTTPNNKFLGSARYWVKETASVGQSVKLHAKTGAGGGGTAVGGAGPGRFCMAGHGRRPLHPGHCLLRHRPQAAPWPRHLASVRACRQHLPLFHPAAVRGLSHRVSIGRPCGVRALSHNALFHRKAPDVQPCRSPQLPRFTPLRSTRISPWWC